MSPKIFLTGVTGYIAGDALYALHQKHPEYEYAALVRTQDKADLVKQAYPNIRIVLGGLDDSNLLKEEAAKADVVLHAADASDHEGAARAIAAGLQSRSKPGYWLHTGGTGILTYEDSKADRLGSHSDKIYNDWTGISELTNLPDEAFHRNVDKIVLEAGSGKHADICKTNIVCPPTIYGAGRGPVSTRGRQIYELSKLILTAGFIPIIGAGKARWNNVHVADLSDVYVLLVEAALNPSTKDSEELWGAKGYTIVEAGEHCWSDIARTIGMTAYKQLGYLSEEPKEQALSKEKALEQAGFEAVSWGLNSRARGERARKVLGWKPHRQTLEETVPEILRNEKARLG